MLLLCKRSVSHCCSTTDKLKWSFVRSVLKSCWIVVIYVPSTIDWHCMWWHLWKGIFFTHKFDLFFGIWNKKNCTYLCPAKQNPTRLNFSQTSFMTFHYVPISKKQWSVKVLASVVLKLQWQTAGWTKHQFTYTKSIQKKKLQLLT